jgi:hypothetical protein
MNTNKLLGILALSVAVVFSTSAANATETKTAPTAQACKTAADVVAKHDLGCKLTKAEKKEYKAKKAAKTTK